MVTLQLAISTAEACAPSAVSAVYSFAKFSIRFDRHRRRIIRSGVHEVNSGF